MNKLELLNRAFLEARKANEPTAKALFSTFKGAYENERKSSDKTDDSIIESIAKKFTENAKVMKNVFEMELLKPFMPKEVANSEYYISINEVLTNNIPKVEEFKAGKAQNIGLFMGLVMKDLKTRLPGQDVNPETVTNLLKQSLSVINI